MTRLWGQEGEELLRVKGEEKGRTSKGRAVCLRKNIGSIYCLDLWQ